MPYLDSRGYCAKCDKVTAHRYSLIIHCKNCGLQTTVSEYAENEKKQKK